MGGTLTTIQNLISPPPPPPPPLDSLAFTPDEQGIPLYALAVTDKCATFFMPACSDFVEMSRWEVKVDDPHEDSILLISALTRQHTGSFSVPSATFLNKYTSRNSFVCPDADVYREAILPALLLGCRVRDFEHRCASVDKLSPLVLTLPRQYGRPTSLKLKTTTGITFSVSVASIKDDDEKQWTVTCRDALGTLPEELLKGSKLEILGSAPPTESRIAGALKQYYVTKKTAPQAPIGNWPLLAAIYGEPAHLVLPPVSRAEPAIRPSGGAAKRLNAQQAEALARYNCPRCPGFVIEAPPGSGKTLTAAAMAVSYQGSGVQLFLSTANVPVFNMALQFSTLDYGRRRPIHLMSSESEDKMTEETSSPFSTLSLAKAQEKYRKKIEQLEQDMARAPCDEDRKKLKQEIRDACGPILDEEHDIYFATVDTILGRLFKRNKGGKTKKDKMKDQLTNAVDRVVIDEASQLTEASLNAIILSFPKAQIVLIGDSKQLEPFRYCRGETVSELSSRSALDVVKDKGNLPVIKLKEVYRAPAALIAHYSNAFYDGSLVSGKPETAKNHLECFGSRRTGGSECLFWQPVTGKSETPPGSTSKINRAEIKSLKYIMFTLKDRGYDEKSIMIISYYEAQRAEAENALKYIGFDGFEVLTVDSAQGREKKIVIVLTTRTGISADREEDFINSPKRCNVAVSRHQEALIVIGHPSLGHAPHWGKVLSSKHFHHVEDNGPRR